MDALILTPPIAFLIFVLIFFAFSKGFSRYSHVRSGEADGLDSYACGQRDVRNYVNPDYSQFFPFAFLFTIMHVLVLVVATAPYDAPILPVVFIAAGMSCLAIIFKR